MCERICVCMWGVCVKNKLFAAAQVFWFAEKRLCYVCWWVHYNVRMQKGSGEINCPLEILLCFTDNRQVLCVCVYVFVCNLNSGVHIPTLLTLPPLYCWPASQLHQPSNRSTPLTLIYINTSIRVRRSEWERKEKEQGRQQLNCNKIEWQWQTD